MVRIVILSWMVLFGASLSLFGDDDLMDMSLNELLDMEIEVEVASKSAEKIWDAPGIVTVMSAVEIDQMGAVNLVDLLNRVTSVYMLNTYFSPNNFTSFRGDSSSNYDNHVLILLNGRPMRESQNGSFNAAIYQAFPIEAIDRIEVIRGPGSVLYGANAFSGVINLVTGGDAGTRVDVHAGSFDGAGGHIDSLGGWRGLEYHISAGTFTESGWDFEAVDEAGVAQNLEMGEENYSFFINLAYGDWHLEALGVRSTYDYWGGSPSGGGSERDLGRYFGNLGWHRESGRWNTEVNLTYNVMDINDGGVNETEDLLFEVTTFYQWGEKTTLTLGGLVDNNTGEFGAIVLPYDRTNSSAYMQVEYRHSDALKLIAGGQYNKPDRGSSDFVPRLGFIYDFTPKTGVKVLYGEAFRSPAAVETDFNIPPFLSGNPDLNPEKVATTEIQVFHDGANYQVAGTFFNTEQKDLIGRLFVTEPTPGFTYRNLGTGTFQGLEFEGKYAPSEHLYTTFSTTWQQNENQDGIDGFTTMPDFMAKIGLVRRFGSRTTLGVFNSYFGDAEGNQTTNPEVTLANPAADAFHLVSANLEFSLKQGEGGKGMKLSLFSQNLLDEETHVPEIVRRNINTMPAYAGRSIYGKLSWTF